MNPDDIIAALRLLDELYIKKDKFKDWLKGGTHLDLEYNMVSRNLEESLPGLKVVYVNITFRMAHALVPKD